MIATAAAIALFVLKALVSVVVLAIAAGLPGAVILLITMGISEGCSWLYKNFYFANRWFDRIVHHKLRMPVAAVFILGPPIIVGLSTYIGYGIPFTKDLWHKDEEKVAAPPPVLVKSEIRSFKIISYRPPKGYYVTLEDSDTDKGVWKDVWVGSYCNNYASNHVGDKVNLKIEEYREANGSTFGRFTDIYRVLCE